MAAQPRAGQVRLQPRPQQGCARCERGEGCGGGLLGKLIRRRHSGLVLKDPELQLRAGELVVVGVPEATFLRATAITYLLPVLALIAAALLATGAGATDGLVALAGALAFGLALWLGRHLNAGLMQPRIVRRASLAEQSQCGTPQT